MGTRTKRALLVSAVTAALLAGVGLVFWNPQPVTAAPDPGSGQVPVGDLSEAAGKRIFFGHMSVGWNLLSGVERLYAANGRPAPLLQKLDLAAPSLPAGGLIVHAEIGINGDPLGKLANFDAALRGGVAEQVDVAVLKFCYVDLVAGTDAAAVFDSYRRTLDALQRDFPRVRFVHTTAPLTVAPSGVKEHLKVLLRGDDNRVRREYNELVRSAYPAQDIIDLAAVETTAPDGTPVDGLYRGYTDDGSHLNNSGAMRAAIAFVSAIAATEEA